MANHTTSAQRELFLEYLFNDPECQNNSLLAARKAGYSDKSHSSLVRDAKTQILVHAEEQLAKAAPKAVTKLIGMMDEDGSIPKAETRLKAIESVLDRIGVARKQEIEIKTDKDSMPIFMIPAKTEQQEIYKGPLVTGD